MQATSDLLETYASYVSAWIVRTQATDPVPITAPTAERFPAAVLFADISGSTTLAERLAQHGAAGAEELRRLFNIYFGQLISTVTAHGGDVVKFAGDALLACWPATATDEPLSTVTRHAAQCGLAMQARLHDYEVAEGLRLSLRVGIGAGEVLAATVGGVGGRWEFLMAGVPLVQMSLAEHQADPGQAIVAPEAWALLQEHCVGHLLPEGFVQLEAVGAPLPLHPLAPVSPSPGSEAILQGYIPRAILSRVEAGQIGWLAELRLATVLFLNLTGLDYARLDAVDRVQDAMQAIQTTLYRYGGSVGRFGVDDKGTVLKAVFGLPPHTHEDDPARAVRAALEMRARLCALGLECGIGIATGAVFCGSIGSRARREYTLVGDVVNTAARLMEASQNDVLCNAETYQSAQTRLPFQTLPQFALKGKAEPVAVYRALGDARDAGRLPAMVGRTTERATLAAHLQALGDGRSGTLLIEGWAGIGKSRLVADLLQQASASGVASWVGAGDALEKSTPYHAWRSIFLQLFGLDELAGLEARRALVLDRLAPEPALSRLTPLLNAVVSLDLPENEFTKELTGEVRADNRHDLLVRLLQMAATTTPLLLILEDGQWLDSASWALMRLVHKHVQPVLLVVAARPMDSLLPEPYLLVRDAPGTQRLHLDALSLEDTRELLSERLGVPGLSEALVTLIHDWAEGSPLFTEELAYFLRDRGLIHVSNGVCQVAPNGGELTLSTLPKSVEVVIASRVAQLTAEQQFTLKVASAIGRAFPYRLLQDIYPIGVDRDQLRKDLDALERLDVIALLPSAMEETYTFKQIITHQVVYGRLPFALRRQLHQAIAEWYERTYAGDLSPFGPLLAHHWYRVTGLSPEPDLALPAGDLLTRPLVPEVTVRAPTTVEVDAHAVARTIEYSEEAGEQALRNFANEEAVAFLSGALELDAEREHRSGPLRRARWELQLGEAYVNWSKYAEGRQHLEAGLGLLGQPVPAALPGQVVSLVGQVLRQLLFRSSSARRVVHSAEGRSALLAASRAYERLTEVYYFANETVLSLVAALRTLNLAEAAGPSPELARGYAAVGALLGLIPLRGMADAYSCRALEAVEDVDHQPARAFVSLAVGFYYAGVGDWDRAQQRFEEVVEISERLGNRRRRDDGLSGSLYVNYFRGAFSSCGQVADDLIRSAIRRDDPRSWASGLQAKACCLLRTGRFDEAIRCLQQSQSLLATGAGTVDEAMEIELYGLFSSALLHRSEHGQALAVAGKLADLTTEAYPSNFGTLVGYAAPAEVYLALWEANHPQPDLGDLARKACKTLRGFARVFSIGQPRASLWQGLYEWLAGKPAKASKAWHESLDAAERLSMPYDQGLAHYEIGRHLAQNDPARRKHLTRAGELFADLGASHNLRLAEEELAQSQSA